MEFFFNKTERQILDGQKNFGDERSTRGASNLTKRYEDGSRSN